MVPSVKTIQRIHSGPRRSPDSPAGGQPMDAETARTVRAAMIEAESAGYNFMNPGRECRDALRAIDAIIGGYGVEHIRAGRGARSPAIWYVNLGDTYETTILYVRGRFRVGCWGDIVERGNYE